MESNRTEKRLPMLSRVQKDALQMVTQNKTLGEIVDAMWQKHGIGEKAVDRWLQSAIRCLEAQNLPEAAEIARENGLLDQPGGLVLRDGHGGPSHHRIVGLSAVQ